MSMYVRLRACICAYLCISVCASFVSLCVCVCVCVCVSCSTSTTLLGCVNSIQIRLFSCSKKKGCCFERDCNNTCMNSGINHVSCHCEIFDCLLAMLFAGIRKVCQKSQTHQDHEHKKVGILANIYLERGVVDDISRHSLDIEPGDFFNGCCEHGAGELGRQAPVAPAV